MKIARLFMNGRSQAVRLPKEFQFDGDSVYVQKVGHAVILVPVDKVWETFLHSVNNFSDDFMSEGRLQDSRLQRADQKRDEL